LNPPRRGRPWRLVDVAGGTGDIAFRVAERSQGHADITVADINPEMLAVGRARAEKRKLENIAFVEANAEALPFDDSSFDAYTIAFGIRNVPRIAAALEQAFRVLRHGGRFVCLEFSAVDTPMLDRVYDAYSFAVIPRLGKAVTGDAESYRYLVESIRTFPNQENFADMIRAAGFARVNYRNFSGGIAALHSGWKL
jgi:demethylmenaquinone methyltransferase/2-methoxy-6-polyprenyl-1,4-benzoquinol methylase